MGLAYLPETRHLVSELLFDGLDEVTKTKDNTLFPSDGQFDGHQQFGCGIKIY